MCVADAILVSLVAAASCSCTGDLGDREKGRRTLLYIGIPVIKVSIAVVRRVSGRISLGVAGQVTRVGERLCLERSRSNVCEYSVVQRTKV